MAQSTDKMDWSKIELKVYSTANVAAGWIYLPNDNRSNLIFVTKSDGKFVMKNNPFEGKVGFVLK